MRTHSSLTVGFDRLIFSRDAAAQQTAALRRLAHSAPLLDRVLAHVVAVRGHLAGESGRDARRVAVDQVTYRDGVGSLIARGEILVRGAGGDAAVSLLERLGYDYVCSVGPVIRLRRPGTPGSEVLAACRALRDLRIDAGPNHVAAVAPVGKGALGVAAPMPTAIDPGPRPRSDDRGAGVSVAIIDTGIDPVAVDADHGWLAGIAAVDGPEGNRDLLDSVPAPDGYLDDAAGHGTFVAGLVRQMAPGCDVIALRALDSDGIGTEFSVAEALFRLAEADVAPDVVNLSLACGAGEGLEPLAIGAALDALAQNHPDTIVVAAAGNDGTTAPAWPATHKSVVAVGALDQAGPAAYSNRGYWVDFSVPADGVVSTYVRGTRPPMETAAERTGERGAPVQFTGDYAAWAGTSFAAPQVAGALASLMSAEHSARAAIGELRRNSIPVSGCGRALTRPAGLSAGGALPADPTR